MSNYAPPHQGVTTPPDATVAWIRELTEAWECCGTCAGGVLIKRDRYIKAEALREFGNRIATPTEDWHHGPTLYHVWAEAQEAPE